MLQFHIRSSSKLWVTKLGLIAGLACNFALAADPAVVTHVKKACHFDETWVFSPAMRSALPAANIQEFQNFLANKEHGLRSFGEGLALNASKESAENAFADYWKGRALYSAAEFGLAIDQFNALIERKPTLGTYPFQLAAMSCLQIIHERYPVSVYSENALNNLPNYFKAEIVPDEFKTPLYEAGIHMVMRALKEKKSRASVEKLIEYLNKSGPYEAFARAMWTIENNRPEEASLFLTGLSESDSLPTSIKVRQNDLRILNARVLYELGRNKEAAKSLDAVDRKSNSFINSLVTQTWNDLARQEYTKAVGTSIALQSGQLRRTFAPEALMVSAIALNELCLYPESLQMLQTFRKHYEKSFRWLLERTGKKVKPEEKYYPIALEYIKGDNPAVPDRVITEWFRSPVFIGTQQAINLSFAQERAVPNLVKEATAYHYSETLKLGALRLDYERKLAHLIAKRDAKIASELHDVLKKATEVEYQAKKFADTRTKEKNKIVAESKETMKRLADAEKLAKKSALESETAAKRSVDADLASKAAADAEVLAKKNLADADDTSKKAAAESEAKGKFLVDRNKDSSMANAEAKAAADSAADAVAKSKPAADKAKATAKAAADAKDLAKKLADAEVNAKKVAMEADSAAKKIVDGLKEFTKRTADAKAVAKTANDKEQDMTKLASSAKTVAKTAADNAKDSARKVADAKDMAKKASEARAFAMKTAENEVNAKKKAVAAAEKAKKLAEDEASAKSLATEATTNSTQLADAAKTSAQKAADAAKAVVKAKLLAKNVGKKTKTGRQPAAKTEELAAKVTEAQAEATSAKTEATADAKKAASAKAAAAKATAVAEASAQKTRAADLEAKKASSEADASVVKTAEAEAKAKQLADTADTSAKSAAAAEAITNKAVSDAQAALKVATDNETAAMKSHSEAEAIAKKAVDAETSERKTADTAELKSKKLATEAAVSLKKATDSAQESVKRTAEAEDAAKKLAEIEVNVKSFADLSKEKANKAAEAKDAVKKAAEADVLAKKAAAKALAEARLQENRAKQATMTAKMRVEESARRLAESQKAAKKAEETAAKAKALAEQSQEVLARLAVAEENLKKASDEHLAAKKVTDEARIVWKKAADKALLSARKAAELDARSKLPQGDLAKIPKPSKLEAENSTPEMVALYATLETAEGRQERLTKALPIWNTMLTKFKENAVKHRDSLIAKIEKLFRATNEKMMRRLATVLENNDLIEAEIWNGASADLVWQNAHPEFQNMVKSGEIAAAPDKKGEVKSRSDVYVWGKMKTTLEAGQDEVWEDELGNVMANLEDNCGNKEKYMNLKRKK